MFHGGSGSELCDIHEALDYGTVKMNIDTDMQYAFTRAIADHCFKNYDACSAWTETSAASTPTTPVPT